MSFLAKIKKFFGIQTQANTQRNARNKKSKENKLSRSSSTLTRTTYNQPQSSPRPNNNSSLSRNATNLRLQRSHGPNTPSQSNPKPQTLSINIKTLKGVESKHAISSQMIGYELKQYIYQNCCQSLEPKLMEISCEGITIGNFTKLSSIARYVGPILKIIQNKRSVVEISSVVADLNGIDPISLEGPTVRMPCGHQIGRDTMTALVRSLISTNSYQIRCPYSDSNQRICNHLWEFSLCKKVGVFTAEEVDEFEKGLSLNWINKICKNCPRCKKQIYKAELKTNRVVCPSCKFGDFCYLCLKPWKCSNYNFCGNEQSNCPWNKKFDLRDLKDNKKLKPYMTPKYRACPQCHLILEHTKACKHMSCPSCTRKFCWVCLEVPAPTWPCGNFNDYCGKVAEAQKL